MLPMQTLVVKNMSEILLVALDAFYLNKIASFGEFVVGCELC